jgi:predicted membrane protein
MFYLQKLCSPALLYLLFSSTQIIIDMFNRMYNTALMKLLITIVMTFTLNLFCNRGLTLISWIIVFIPFILMSVITTVLLLMLGLSPFKGKIKFKNHKFNNKLNDLDILNNSYSENNDVTTYSKINKFNTTHLNNKNNGLIVL